MACKRPVRLLPEVMSGMNLGEPHYVPMHGEHSYQFMLRVADTTAFGCGYTETEAKQNAARCILRVLREKQMTAENLRKKEAYERAASSMEEDVVAKLDDFCWDEDLGAPDYKLETSSARTFTCVCTVSGEEVSGTGFTVRRAKEVAARNMLTKLKAQLHEESQDSEDSDATIKAEPPEDLGDPCCE